jgi:hypothetical protein
MLLKHAFQPWIAVRTLKSQPSNKVAAPQHSASAVLNAPKQQEATAAYFLYPEVLTKTRPRSTAAVLPFGSHSLEVLPHDDFSHSATFSGDFSHSWTDK